MAQLLLLRHAKAKWGGPGMRDFDRPLEERGVDDAANVAREMKRLDLSPTHVACSSSRRTRETWSGLDLDSRLEPDFLDELFEATAAGYLDVIRRYRMATSLLVIGHNPVMEDLATALVADAEPEARRDIEAGFPTCGLAVLSFSGPLSDVAPGSGRLERFIRPKHLRN